MRISRLPTLAAGLSIGGLFIGGLAAYGSMHDTAAAAALSPGVSWQCEPLPMASTAASPTPSPTDSGTASASSSPTASSSPNPADLCVSVQAGQDSFQAGQAATWDVEVWAPNGPVTGVTVYLTGSLSGQAPTFTATCPGGNGNSSCTVGDLATDVTAGSDTMEAQIAIPSGTAAGTSVTLTAIANATPALPTAPTAATTVTATAAPAPSSSPTSAQAAATPSSSKPSATAAATAPATAPPTAPATAPTTPGTTTLLPGIGTLPNYTSLGTPSTGVSTVASAGSINGLLPVIAPGAGATSPTAGFVTSPAADIPASPGAAATDRASDSNSVLVIPTATAEKIGIVILLVLGAVALRMRLRTKDTLIPRALPGRASRGARNQPSPSRRKPLDSSKKTDDNEGIKG
jgi:hypothetical protein